MTLPFSSVNSVPQSVNSVHVQAPHIGELIENQAKDFIG
jgi:hypothetical protein